MASLIEIAQALKKLGSAADQILANPVAADLHQLAEEIHKFVADTKVRVRARVDEVARLHTLAKHGKSVFHAQSALLGDDQPNREREEP
jgi:hypothetical protein